MAVHLWSEKNRLVVNTTTGLPVIFSLPVIRIPSAATVPIVVPRKRLSVVNETIVMVAVTRVMGIPVPVVQVVSVAAVHLWSEMCDA